MKSAYQLEPDLWDRVQASPEFIAGREENSISIFWDALIEHVTKQYLDRDLEFGNEMQMSDYKRLIRLMAGETRVFRRILTKCILERADLAREHAIGTMLPSDQADVTYVIFIGRGDQGADHKTYRAERLSHLKSRCYAAKAVTPDRRYIVGIAVDARDVRGSSEDFFFLDTADWTTERIQRAGQLRKERGYFTLAGRIREDEYPGARPTPDLSRLAQDLSSLTVLEAAELAKMLEEKWQPSAIPVQ